MGSFPETYNDPREPACVASDSARVRRESWNESKRVECREGEGGRVREGNTELISDRDVASLKLSFHQSLF